MDLFHKLNLLSKKFSFPDDFSHIIPLAIQPIDKEFNKDDIIKYAKNLFFIISDAYCDNDYYPVRPIACDELYFKIKEEITAFANDNKRKIFEEIKIIRPFLHLYERNDEYEHLYIVLSTSLKTYIMEDKHKNIIDGDSQKVKKQFMLTLKRKYGTPTASADRKNSGRHCPNCERSFEFNENGICSHCNKLITSGEFNWVLEDFFIITSENDFDNRGVVIG